MKRGKRGLTYEQEVSDRRATGSVSIGAGVWWSAQLAVAIRDDQKILLTVQRHGPPEQTTGPNESVDLFLRPADLDALPVLLTGVIAQARRDGILRAA